MLQGKTLSQDSRVKVDGEVDYRGDGPMVKSGQKAYFYNAIVYESYARSPKPPIPELCPRPISCPSNCVLYFPEIDAETSSHLRADLRPPRFYLAELAVPLVIYSSTSHPFTNVANVLPGAARH